MFENQKVQIKFGFNDYPTNYPSEKYCRKCRLNFSDDTDQSNLGQICLNYAPKIITSRYYTQIYYSLPCRAMDSKKSASLNEQMVDPQAD